MTLSERCEKAEGPDRALDREIARAQLEWIFRGKGEPDAERMAKTMAEFRLDADLDAYTASIDAAMGLVPEGWTYSAQQGPSGKPHSWQLSTIGEADQRYTTVSAKASTPALALCAAALKARGL